MEYKNKEIRDDEIRIIGLNSVSAPKASEAGRGSRRGWLTSLVSLVIVADIGLACFFFWPKKGEPGDVEGVFEQSLGQSPATVAASGRNLFGTPVTDTPYTEKIDTVINDVRLSLYGPQNATPVLYVGNPEEQIHRGALAFQAADIRADNKEILGAFVLKGQPLAWGLSKKGYCAIIDGKVTVGVSENSPLFEEATEKDGYFFRQYPLVDNGILVENEPKNKTMRKALCDREGEIFVAVSETDESFHDFAQALVDLGVDNAIYLVGSHTSFGWAVRRDGTRETFGSDDHRTSYKNESYIIWM